MIKIYEERNIKSLFMKYTIFDDRIRIQGFPGLYYLNIKFKDIIRVEIRKGPVIRDFIRSKRVIKNDLADLFDHIAIVKRRGVWRDVRITPKEPRRFLDVLKDAISSYRDR